MTADAQVAGGTNNTAPAAPQPAAPAAEAPKAAPVAEAPKAPQAAPQNTAPTADAPKAPADGKEAPKAPDAPQGAPEKYEFKADSISADLLPTYSEAAKELGLPQDKAQAMIDKMAPKIAEVQQAQFNALRASWVDEAKNDPEIGGGKLAEHSALAKKAYHVFGTPKMQAILNETGLGDNIEFIRMFSRVGKLLAEDNRFVRGGVGPVSEQSAEARLYPNQQQRK